MQDGAIQFGTGYVLPSSLFFPEKRNKPVAGSGLFYSAVIPSEPRQQNYNTAQSAPVHRRRQLAM
jgi:hypothetical protein